MDVKDDGNICVEVFNVGRENKCGSGGGKSEGGISVVECGKANEADLKNGSC